MRAGDSPASHPLTPPRPDRPRRALGLAGEDLLVGVGRQDWKWAKEVFRYDPSGRLVKRYGAGEGKGVLNGPMNGCGDGFCLVTGYSFEIFDREGQQVTKVDLDALELQRMNVNGVVDVPGKGVYVLVGYYVEKDVAQAELLRLEGVY